MRRYKPFLDLGWTAGSSRMPANPHLTLVSRSETQIFVDPAAFPGTWPRSSKLQLSGRHPSMGSLTCNRNHLADAKADHHAPPLRSPDGSGAGQIDFWSGEAVRGRAGYRSH